MADTSVKPLSGLVDDKPEYSGAKMRVAIIGCGGISQCHMEGFKAIPQVEVVAGVDIDPKRLKIMDEKWGVAKLYKDWKVMLKEVKPDAVSICTPNGLHAQPTIDACNAGAHVMVEKPMAMNPAECRQMIDAAQKNHKKLSVGFQYRYHPYTEFITRARDEGQFGQVMFVKCQALRRRGIPNYGVFGRKDLQGGGPLIDIGVHVIEMAHYVMGSPRPLIASGNIWTFMGNKKCETLCKSPNWDFKAYTVEDMAIGQIRFENGALLHIEASFAAHIKDDIWNFTLAGDKGGATWDPPEIYTDWAGTMMNAQPAYVGKTDFQSLITSKLQNFVDGCMNDRALRAPGEAGLAVQKMLDGIYRSAEAGREVAID